MKGLPYLSLCLMLTVSIGEGAQAQAEEERAASFRFRRPVVQIERPVRAPFRAPSPPEPDGRLSEDWWAEALVSEDFHGPGGGPPAASRARLKVAYDDAHLYIAARAFSRDPEAMRREAEPGGGRGVWGDDCFDMKLSADAGASEVQILINPNGALDTFYRRREETPGAEIHGGAQVTDQGFNVEVVVPWAALGIDRLDGTQAVAFAFGRAETRGEGMALSTAFGEGWGDVEVTSPILVPGGDPAAFGQTAFTRQVSRMTLFTAREEYPAFARGLSGRLVLETSPAGPALQGEGAIELTLTRETTVHFHHRMAPLRQARLDFELPLADLEPGEYMLQARYLDGEEPVEETRVPVRIQAATPPARQGEVPLRVSTVEPRMPAWPITFGVPFPWGAVMDEAQVRIRDARGVELPIQTQVTGRWGPGESIRWLQVTFMPPVGPEAGALTLDYGPDVKRSPAEENLAVEEGDRVVVDTGPVHAEIPVRGADRGALRLARVEGDRRTRVFDSSHRPDAYMVRADGTAFRARYDGGAEVVLEENGPLQAVVRVSGYHRTEEGERLGRYILRYHFRRGMPTVELHHTFIFTEDSNEVQYREIGYELPIASREVFLGTPQVHRADVARDGAVRLIQRDDRHFRIYQAGRFRDEGMRAQGWLTAGRAGNRVTVAVRDFWQNFPKELEVTDDTVYVHLWPRHGEPRLRTGDNLAIENVHPLWFAHEGEVLDFRVPGEDLELFARDTIPVDVDNARAANAVGMAKTHEMLIYVHGESWDDARAFSHHQAFQEDPAAVCDPAWVAASGVYGRMHPRDPETYPEAERAIDACFEGIVRVQRDDRDYGMWNFGDSHHSWNWDERRWSLHRIWYQTHHGWTRWPWILYARSGDFEYLRWARRNSRHAADIVHVHYAPEAFRGLGYPREKIVGAKNDYKGFVHWASGSRIGYNSVADALLWHAYHTGNRRSLETAMAHGRAMLEDGRVNLDRSGSARVVSAVALYEKTWDADYLEFIERTMDGMLHNQHEDGFFRLGKENFAPFLDRYITLTGRARAREALKRQADWLASEPIGRQWDWLWHVDVLALAYHQFGEERHLGTAAAKMQRWSGFVYEGEDPRHRGVFLTAPGNLHRSYFMQQAPYYLSAVEELGRTPEPRPDPWHEIRAFGRETIDGEDRRVFRAFLRMEDADRAFTLRPRITRNGQPQETQRAMIRPRAGGEAIVAVPSTVCRLDGGYWTAPDARARGSADSVFELHVPADGHREYEVILMAARDFFVKLPICDDPATGEVYMLDGGPMLQGLETVYFVPPPEAQRVEVEYRARLRGGVFEILTPSGRRVFRDMWIDANADGPRLAAVDLDTEERGPWAFSLHTTRGGSLDQVRFLPEGGHTEFLFSVRPGKYFVP